MKRTGCKDRDRAERNDAMTFSERMKIVNPRTMIQTESLDEETRNAIWNVISPFFKEYSSQCSVYNDVWTELYHKTSDTYPDVEDCYNARDSFYQYFRGVILADEWNCCLDLVEFLGGGAFPRKWNEEISSKQFGVWEQYVIGENDFNEVFEKFLVGYRFVEGLITPITSQPEIDSIVDAVEGAPASVGEQLQKAIRFFSDRTHPEYPKSVDCSISAVEAQCRILLNDPVPTLGKALKKLEDEGIAMHGSLKAAFEKLYGFTSDADGIRHAGLKPSDVDQDLAKFMLVSCSAFVNYLRAKQ